MRRPTGDQEVAGSTPADVGNILSWNLIMKYFQLDAPSDWRPGVANSVDPHHPVSILHKSIAGPYRPVTVADGPITAR